MIKKYTTVEAYSPLTIGTFNNWAKRFGFTVEFTEVNKHGIPMVGLVNGKKIGTANQMYAFFRKELRLERQAVMAARRAA